MLTFFISIKFSTCEMQRLKRSISLPLLVTKSVLIEARKAKEEERRESEKYKFIKTAESLLNLKICLLCMPKFLEADI